MLYLSRFNQAGAQEALFDPFCGSGTIPIEGALMLSNTAPGLNRAFAGENWSYIGKKSFDMMREEALEAMIRLKPQQIRLFGSDLDAKAVSLAVDNSMRAGVGDWIRFKQQDVRQITGDWLRDWTGLPYHLVVCNPPYGERLLDDNQATELYQAVSGWTLDNQGNSQPGIRLSIITPDERFEEIAGGKADKRRKLYNGMIRCTMYHYFKQSRSDRAQSR
jgi:putative N6-adenine-specific DNA methylase